MYERKKHGERLNDECVLLTFNPGDGSVIVWDCLRERGIEIWFRSKESRKKYNIIWFCKVILYHLIYVCVWRHSPRAGWVGYIVLNKSQPTMLIRGYQRDECQLLAVPTANSIHELAQDQFSVLLYCSATCFHLATITLPPALLAVDYT